MGTRLIQQRRGTGSPTYKAPSHRYLGRFEYVSFPPGKSILGEVIDLVNCVGHDTPVMVVEYETGDTVILPAPLGIKVGDKVWAGEKKELMIGSVLKLADIPTGVDIYNLENKPFSNGKFVRNTGGVARILGKTSTEVTVQLPSRKKINLHPFCRALIGRAAGGGRTEKPMLKAGKKHYAKHARNKLYPHVKGVSMNAVDHPHGGTHSRQLGLPTAVSHHAPPGAKVGLIGASRTGRRKR